VVVDTAADVLVCMCVCVCSERSLSTLVDNDLALSSDDEDDDGGDDGDEGDSCSQQQHERVQLPVQLPAHRKVRASSDSCLCS